MDDFTVYDIDFTELVEPIAEMQTVAYYLAQEQPLELARSPFRQAIRRLRAALGQEVQDRIDQFSQTALESLQELTTTARRRLLDAIQATSSETRTERRNRIRSELRKSTADARTQLRTAANLAHSTAQAIRVREMGDTVWGFRYVTAEDERVRDNHEEMHGVTRPKEDPVWLEWWPPNGWN